mmetsp:Transcript_7922/g.25408  ORF Transcript_7922/g.25408 Transcript_7922/m.25408 type:complete len:257 (-) Transcript_7922:1798-2568(-)
MPTSRSTGGRSGAAPPARLPRRSCPAVRRASRARRLTSGRPRLTRSPRPPSSTQTRPWRRNSVEPSRPPPDGPPPLGRVGGGGRRCPPTLGRREASPLAAPGWPPRRPHRPTKATARVSSPGLRLGRRLPRRPPPHQRPTSAPSRPRRDPAVFRRARRACRPFSAPQSHHPAAPPPKQKRQPLDRPPPNLSLQRRGILRRPADPRLARSRLDRQPLRVLPDEHRQRRARPNWGRSPCPATSRRVRTSRRPHSRRAS